MSILLETSELTRSVLSLLLAALCVGLVMAWRDRGARAFVSSPRVRTPNEAAPAWVGLGVMLMFYIYVPVAARALFIDPVPASTQPATASTTQPTMQAAQPIDLAVAIGSIAVTYALAILSAFAVHAYMRTQMKRLFGLTAPAAGQWRLLLIVGLVSIPATYFVAMLTQFLLERLDLAHETSHPMLQWMTQLHDRPALKLLTIATATLAAPVFEEWFFRAHLQTALVVLLRGRWPAIAIASAVFASLHPWWTIPPIFFFSLCLGWMYEHTGNLWLTIALHVAFNSISTGIFLTSV